MQVWQGHALLAGLIADSGLIRLRQNCPRHNTSLMHLLREILLVTVFLEPTFPVLATDSESESPLTALGRPCSASSNRLDPRTRRFISDCDAQTFCSGNINGTCVPRQCRHEEFPVRYHANQTAPALCPVGSFCPDEGDACRPLVAVGQPCQFNRDDQCAPSNIPGLADFHNFDGSVCLRSCMWLADDPLQATPM